MDRSRFKKLDDKKTPEEKAFYSSRAWTETSQSFRQANPLCVSCKARGRVTAAVLAHHDPDYRTLIATGRDPLDWKYLHASCMPCHNAELSRKQRARDNKGSMEDVLGDQIKVFSSI